MVPAYSSPGVTKYPAFLSRSVIPVPVLIFGWILDQKVRGGEGMSLAIFSDLFVNHLYRVLPSSLGLISCSHAPLTGFPSTAVLPSFEKSVSGCHIFEGL